MRFLFSESSSNVGGQELQILVQMDALRTAGHSTLLVCRGDSEIARLAEKRGLPWNAVRFRNSVDIFSILAVRRLIQKFQIDVGICHSGHDTNIMSLAVHSLWRRPVLLRMRTYLPGKPRAASYNRSVDLTLVPSHYLRQRILENSEINPDKVQVLRPIIPFAALRAEAQLPLPVEVDSWIRSKSPIIVHAAMLRPEKGHAHALNVVARLQRIFPQIGYVVAGAGPKKDSLLKLVAKLGLEESVLFTGKLNPVAPVLVRADVVIMPSLEEPLGLAQAEALALGIPVAVSNAGGLPETVQEGTSGWIFPVGDVDAWEKGLIEILQQKNEAVRRAEQGCKSMKHLFSDTEFFDQLEQRVLRVREAKKSGRSG